MRVLITSSADPDIWQYTTTLSSELASRHGVDVMLLILGSLPSVEQLAMLPEFQALSSGGIEIDHLDVPHESDGAPASAYAEAREEILRITLRWRAHLLHANEHYLGEIGTSGMPVIVVSHRDLCGRRASVDGESPPLVDATYVQLIQQGLASAACVVAPSTFAADSLSRWLDYRGVVRVIPYGVTEHPPGAPVPRTVDVVMAGRLWDPATNVACFQSAAFRLRDRTFAAIGGLSRTGAENITLQNDRVQYVGMLNDIARRRFFESARLFVSPAVYDPSGLEVIEAALAGCCLVLSDVASYRAVWEDSAIYFDPRDPAVLRERIRELTDDAEVRQALAGFARERAEMLYGSERMGSAYHSTYQRLALRYGLAT
jgi:glycogen synthase